MTASKFDQISGMYGNLPATRLMMLPNLVLYQGFMLYQDALTELDDTRIRKILVEEKLNKSGCERYRNFIYKHMSSFIYRHMSSWLARLDILNH